VFDSFRPGNLLKNWKLAFYFAMAVFIFSLLYDIVKLVYFTGRLSERLAKKISTFAYRYANVKGRKPYLFILIFLADVLLLKLNRIIFFLADFLFLKTPSKISSNLFLLHISSVQFQLPSVTGAY